MKSEATVELRPPFQMGPLWLLLFNVVVGGAVIIRVRQTEGCGLQLVSGGRLTPMKWTYRVNETVHVDCPEQDQPNVTRTCLGNGKWSGPWVCRSSNATISNDEECPGPPLVLNADMEILENGTLARYNCLEGYDIRPAGSNGSLNCYQGIWNSSILPKCVFRYATDDSAWELWVAGLISAIIGYLLGFLSLAFYIRRSKTKKGDNHMSRAARHIDYMKHEPQGNNYDLSNNQQQAARAVNHEQNVNNEAIHHLAEIRQIDNQITIMPQHDYHYQDMTEPMYGNLSPEWSSEVAGNRDSQSIYANM